MVQPRTLQGDPIKGSGLPIWGKVYISKVNKRSNVTGE